MDASMIADDYADRDIMPKGHVPCPICHGDVIPLGSGRLCSWEPECQYCHGTGTVPIDKAIAYEEAHHDQP